MDKMKNHYQITIDKLHRRIEELEAEVASESKWAETYNNRVVELEAEVERLAHVTQQQAALINAQRAEIDRLCGMLGEADSRTTRPKGGDA
jgi:cell division septum initiation protein DivIVA